MDLSRLFLKPPVSERAAAVMVDGKWVPVGQHPLAPAVRQPNQIAQKPIDQMVAQQNAQTEQYNQFSNMLIMYLPYVVGGIILIKVLKR